MFLNDHLTYLKAVSYVPKVINTLRLKHKAITKYVGYGYNLDQLQILTLVEHSLLLFKAILHLHLKVSALPTSFK